MSPLVLLEPQRFRTNRSLLRQRQRSILRKAKGSTVVVVAARGKDSEKYVLDKRYFEEVLAQLRAALETLEVTADSRLFTQLLRASETIDEDVRLSKLHSFEEAFGRG